MKKDELLKVYAMGWSAYFESVWDNEELYAPALRAWQEGMGPSTRHVHVDFPNGGHVNMMRPDFLE